MLIQKEIDFNKPLTEAQEEMLVKLEARPVVPDEECPELTAEEIKNFRTTIKSGKGFALA